MTTNWSACHEENLPEIGKPVLVWIASHKQPFVAKRKAYPLSGKFKGELPYRWIAHGPHSFMGHEGSHWSAIEPPVIVAPVAAPAHPTQ